MVNAWTQPLLRSHRPGIGTGLVRCNRSAADKWTRPSPGGRRRGYALQSTLGDEANQCTAAPLVPAPDGSDVRILCGVQAASSALFSLAPGAVARAVVHGTVEEDLVRPCRAGEGCGDGALATTEEMVELLAGRVADDPGRHRVSVPRNDGADVGSIYFGVTMPPWPGDGRGDVTSPAPGSPTLVTL